jgi:PST family polysaccharide transporter
MLKFGGNITASNLAGYLNLTLDNVMIGIWLGEFALGLYDRAWKLAAQPLFQITAPVNRVAVPVLARLLHSPERYKSAFVRMLQVLLLVTTPGFVFLMLNAKPVIEFLFGSKWGPTAPIFAWLCLGAIVTPVNAATYWLFISQGRSREQMKWTTVVSLVNVSAYAIGLHWGIVGVARLSAISVYLIQSPVLFWAVTLKGPVDLKTLIHTCFPFAVSALAAAAFLALLKSIPLGDITVLIILPALTYALSVAVLAVMPSGRSALKSGFDLCRSVNPFSRTAPL